MADSWVIVGCGYVGQRLAVRLARGGAAVIGTRRSDAACAQVAAIDGVTARTVDLSRAKTLAGVIPAGAVVVHAAPPGDSVQGEQSLVQHAAAAGAGRLVYVSSTGVYAAGSSSGWVDEDYPTQPLGELGRRRLAAETALLSDAAAAGLEAVALRVPGIYGPGRGVHARLRAGTFRVVGGGSTWVSRIHVDDLVSAIIAAGRVEPLVGSIYNVADDEPETSRAVADGIAALLGLPPPPSVPVEEVSEAARAMLTANRRIDNRRMHTELRVALHYPSWREGVLQAIAEEEGSDRD